MILLLAGLLAAQDPAAIPWRTEGPSALKEASGLRMPLLVFFHAVPCRNSRALDEGPLAAKTVAAAAGRFIPVKVDVDADPAKWRTMYGVRFTPTLLLLDREGRRVEEVTERTEAELAARLEEAGDRLKGPWARSVEEALVRGKAEGRPVLLVFGWAEGERPADRVHPALGLFLESWVIAALPYAPEGGEARRFSVDETRTWIVADPMLEKPESELMARIRLRGERDEAALRERLKRLLDEWTRAHPRK